MTRRGCRGQSGFRLQLPSCSSGVMGTPTSSTELMRVTTNSTGVMRTPTGQAPGGGSKHRLALAPPSSSTCQSKSIHRSPTLSPLQALLTTTFPWHAHGPQPVSRCSRILESSHRQSSPEVLTLHSSPSEVPPASESLLTSLFQSFH